jgi:ribonuclease VapC
MIVDASALVAILFREPEKDRFRELIARDPEPAISPFNFIEAAVRADGLGPEMSEGFDFLFRETGIRIAASDERQARLAREAYARYGKGNHPAKLNLGDCFAYALAKARDEPLLFKGEDFRLTDVEAAL